MTNKSKKVADRDVTSMSHEDFVVWFMEYFKTAIDRCVYRRLIPNRYESSDIKAYIVERILDILKKRKAKGRPIKDPKLYFRKLIDFYCIEYQRMHGFIYSMPKRPRYPEAEHEISQYGFVYLESIEKGTDEKRSYFNDNRELSYIDINLCNPTNLNLVYQNKGADDHEETDAWHHLMLMVLPEDRDILTCLYRRNMSIPEASKHLNIAISTAYTKRNRAIRAISGTLSQYVDLDKTKWQILDDITKLKKDDINICNLYNVI